MTEKLSSHPMASNGMLLAGALFNVAALFSENSGTFVALGCAFIAIGAGLKTR
jgi:hypothetical protein